MSEAEEEERRRGDGAIRKSRTPFAISGGVIVFASSDLLIWVTARSLKREPGGGPDSQTQTQSDWS